VPRFIPRQLTIYNIFLIIVAFVQTAIADWNIYFENKKSPFGEVAREDFVKLSLLQVYVK
jgi:hypothetical protein